MSAEEEDIDLITEKAAHWLAEAEDGLSPPRQREFDRWQESDPRHAEAVRELQWGQSILRKLPRIREELLPVVAFPAEHQVRTKSAPRPRRNWLAGLAACAAALIVGFTLWWFWPGTDLSGVHYACGPGGYQRVLLQDGSVLELNESSAVVVRLSPDSRHVALLTGEAHFHVAKDAKRPFVVAAQGVAVRAVGTAFRVRLEPSAVDVLVTEGKVAVTAAEKSDSPPGSGAAAPASVEKHLVDVSAGEHTRIATFADKGSVATAGKPEVAKSSPEQVRQTLAWQERKLAFGEMPLRDVVAQFNRRNRLQLVVEDPQLAARPVGGTFAADNVEGFIRLLENSGTVTTDRRSEFEIVLRPRQSPPR